MVHGLGQVLLVVQEYAITKGCQLAATMSCFLFGRPLSLLLPPLRFPGPDRGDEGVRGGAGEVSSRDGPKTQGT